MGEDEEIYLVDFGSIQDRMPTEGKSFTIVGTYGYTPLEQFGGRAVPASDLYALGVTLIHLLTGIPPSELPQKDLQIQLSDCLVRQKHRLEISSHFAQWLTKITHFSAKHRFDDTCQARRAIDFSFSELRFVARRKTQKSKLLLGLIALAAGTYTIQLLSDKLQTKLELSKIEHCRKVRITEAKILNDYCRDIYSVIERVNKKKKSLAGYDLSRMLLGSIDLNEADLERANFHHAYLHDADLQNSNLSYANFYHANLRNANLQNANLKYVNLDRAYLKSADLEESSKELSL